jgi:hypothetical protein
VFISARTSATGPVTNTVTVASSTHDPDSADRSASASTTVNPSTGISQRLLSFGG